ncbi:MAG TPA: glycosyltransferase family 4 protein [Longimicrobiaceae bacterium]|nr:glycosyltransferase family 4 protein [Longimicrobiaceae bacterium]
MRIAVANWSRRALGGAEEYLGMVIRELAWAGHEVALWSELDQPLDRERIALPEGTPEWCAAETGRERALDALRRWRPDVVYTHITTGPDTEAELLATAPAVLFAHAYHGTCVSGQKTHKSPTPTPCGRPLGPGCLAHYYPHRCGGLSPLTMLRDFRRNLRRRELLTAYRAVVTNSRHMRAEYVANGCDPARTHVAPLPVAGPPAGRDAPAAGSSLSPDGPARLLFLGRMDLLKGGRTLVDALPAVHAGLGRPVHAVFAGDGPDRGEWERRAAEARSRCEGVSAGFVGWARGDALEALWADADLLVVPSLWPEPFGMVGPEGGLRGVPAAAFAVGGIPDWLEDGVNGCLAPADPPTAAGLADAVVRCLRDPAGHARLREGALRLARRFSREAHLAALLPVLEEAARGRDGIRGSASAVPT